MTMVPIWKKCPKCHKKYEWNPDVGKFNCPYCHGLGRPGGGIFNNIFSKKRIILDNEELRGTEDTESEN